MGVVTLGDHRFRVDPSGINWTFTPKIKVTHTVGGKVVQVYGVSIERLTMTGSYGVGGFAEQRRFTEKITAMAKAQASSEQPVRLLVPFMNLDMLVFIRALAARGGDKGVYEEPSIVNAQWTLQMSIAEGSEELKTLSVELFIARLSEGIGWVPGPYNGPVSYADLREQIENYDATIGWGDSVAGAFEELLPAAAGTTGQVNPDAGGTEEEDDG